MTAANAAMPSERRRAIEPQAAAVQRHHEADEQRAEDPQLQRRGVLDQREIGAAMVEHHHLVDHRQLEMRGRVVDRDAAVFDQFEHQQASSRRAPASASACGPGADRDRRRRPASATMPPVTRASVASASSRAGSAKAAKCTSRLAPIPSKLDPVSSAASTVANRPSANSPTSTMRSPEKLTGAPTPANGTTSSAADQRRQIDHRPQPEQRARHLAVDRAAAQQHLATSR